MRSGLWIIFIPEVKHLYEPIQPQHPVLWLLLEKKFCKMDSKQYDMSQSN